MDGWMDGQKYIICMLQKKMLTWYQTRMRQNALTTISWDFTGKIAQETVVGDTSGAC